MNENEVKKLLRLEIVLGVIVSIILCGCILIASLIEMPIWLRSVIITIGILIFAIGLIIGIRIEQTAGYYECKNCHHKYVPKYFQTLIAPHINRTRYMKCPECGKRTWNKKRIN